MTKYAALLRGIGPTNPNMRGEKLRGVFESLGFTNVRTVLTSGNVLFESSARSVSQLEKTVEAAIVYQLGFTSTTIIRSQAELQAIVDASPFKGMTHNRETYLCVTFLQTTPVTVPDLPLQPEGKSYRLLSLQGQSLCGVVNTTTGKTPDYMTWLERQFGKQITTRTYATVTRLLQKLSQP